VRRHKLTVGLLVVIAVGLACTAGLAVGQPGTDGGQTAAVAQEPGCEFPLTVEDNTGETVEIDQEPEEVVTLLPSVAQQIWEMDAEEKVTGMPVREWTAYLEGSQNRTHVLEFDESVGLSVPNTEVIVDLDPDIVLAPNEVPEESVTELRDAGQTVYYYERPGSLAELTGLIERTGQLIGECTAATDVVEEMNSTIELVESAVADEERPRVFYDSGFGTTVTAGSLQHELLTTAGLENVAAEFDSFQFEPEKVVAADPEWIVTTEGGQLSSFPGYNQTTARQEEQIVRVDPNLFSQRGPRYADIIETLGETFHPQAIETARNGTADDSADDSADDPADNSTDDSTGDDGGDTTDDGDSMDDSADDSTDNSTDDPMDDSVDDAADGNGAGLTVVAAVLALSALLAATRLRSE
jgi:iron complex transport system substrate-binding protein